MPRYIQEGCMQGRVEYMDEVCMDRDPREGCMHRCLDRGVRDK